MAARFFTSELLVPGEFVLRGPEAHHLATVRRFDSGDRIFLFNGDGFEYPAHILALDKKTAILRVESGIAVPRELPVPVAVAAALPKADRADYLLEKLVEVGATRFVPLITERSVVQPKESKAEKFHRAVIEASKQCGRNILMSVDPPAKWSEFVAAPAPGLARLILHTEQAASLPLRELRERVASGVLLAVGPEGGFAPEEIAAAVAAGWQTWSLGPRVLRVETAAVVAVARLAGLLESPA